MIGACVRISKLISRILSQFRANVYTNCCQISLTPRVEPSVCLCPLKVHAPFYLIFGLYERTTPIHSQVCIHIFLRSVIMPLR